MDSAEWKQEDQTQIQCFQGVQRRKPEPKRDNAKTNSAAKNSLDQKRKSVFQEQSSSSRQGSAEQKKTSKNPVANRERKEDKQLVSQQRTQVPAKIQPTNVKSARSIASPPPDAQRDTSTRRFLTSRQQGSLYNNFIESTQKTNLTSSQSQNSQLQASSSSRIALQQSQVSINQKKKKQLNIIAQQKQEISPNKVASVSNLKNPSAMIGFQQKNPPASPQNSENNLRSENLQELSSEMLQNVNFSSVLQNVNISEIVGADQSSSQRSMIQRKHSMSSLIRPNSSSSLSISGWQGPMNLKGIQNDNIEEKHDASNNSQAQPKSTRQKSQLDLLILANPRKTEPLIRPDSQFTSSQLKNQLFKQYQSPKRDITRDATKEAALKQQEALRKWKQYARPDQFEMESSLIGQKDEISNQSLAIKSNSIAGSQRKTNSNSPSNQKQTAAKKQQAKILENMQFQIAESKQKYQNISDGIEGDNRKNIRSADLKQENFYNQPSNSPNQSNSFKIPENIKKCQDAQKGYDSSFKDGGNNLPQSKESSQERNHDQGSCDDGILANSSGKKQDILFQESENYPDAELKRNETSQMQNLRESLKISITSASLHKNSETLGGSLSPGISSNLYQIQEKDSQQNTQRQHFPEQHFLAGVDWKGLTGLRDEFFSQMRHTTIKCPIHADIISLYCEKDKSLLCVSCLFDTEEHQKHTVVPLKAAQASILSNSNLLKAQLKEKVNQFDTGLKKCSANRQQIERSFEKNLDALNKEFQVLKSSINQQQKAMEQQIISYYESALFKYDTLIGDIKEIQTIASESQNHAIPVTASSPLDLIAKEHFVFSTLVATLQHAQFSVADIKKSDLDIFTVKMKQEMKNCIMGYGVVKNLTDKHIGIKPQETFSALNNVNSRINSPMQDKKSSASTARTHNAVSKSSARDTTNSISPSRYDYVQRTLQAHFASSKNLTNSSESQTQQRSKSRPNNQIPQQQNTQGQKQTPNSNVAAAAAESHRGAKQLLASNLKQSLDANCGGRGGSSNCFVNNPGNAPPNESIIIMNQQANNSKQLNQPSNNTYNQNARYNTLTTSPPITDNPINISHYAVDKYPEKSTNLNTASIQNNLTKHTSPLHAGGQLRNNKQHFANNNDRNIQSSYQQQRQQTATSTVMSLQSKRVRELPVSQSTSIS